MVPCDTVVEKNPMCHDFPPFCSLVWILPDFNADRKVFFVARECP